MKSREFIFVFVLVSIGASISFTTDSAQLAIAPMAIAAIAAAVPELIKMGAGWGQKIKSKRLIKNNKMPTLNYPIPKEFYENVMAAKNMAGLSGLPGQGQLENRLEAHGANALTMATQSQQSPAAIMAGVSNMNNDLMGTEADLGVKGAEFRARQLSEYFGANNALAGAKLNKFEKDWDWNQAQPYLAAMSAASALREGGARNAYSGLEGLSSMATSYFANQFKGANNGATDINLNVEPTNQGVGLDMNNADVNNYELKPQQAWFDPITGAKRYGPMPFDFQSDLWKSKEGQPWE